MTDAGLITPLSGLPIFVQLMMAAASLVLGVYCLRVVFIAPSNYNDDNLFMACIPLAYVERMRYIMGYGQQAPHHSPVLSAVS